MLTVELEENRLDNLHNLVSNPTSDVYVDTLLDCLVALYDDCKSSKPIKGSFLYGFTDRYGKTIENIKTLRLGKSDFEELKMIARGFFGEVHLVRCKLNDQIFAMKVLKKSKMRQRQEISFFIEERNVMAIANSHWIVKLHYAFHDEESLYLVMDYCPGGDLMSLLCKYDILDEQTCKFYIAETILAIDQVHQLGFVHRDVKPDNLLIDHRGHLKLTDFGSCIQMNENGRVKSDIPVGTPGYVSPEILRAVEGGAEYGREADWWSVGVVLYEMLIGQTPFDSDNMAQVNNKIMNYKETIVFPDDIPLSEQVKDLIKHLITESTGRLGRYNADDIKSHPFFNDIPWETIYDQKAPFIPEIKSPTDTSNFEAIEYDDGDDFHQDHSTKNASMIPQKNVFMGEHLPFIGFTYFRRSWFDHHSSIKPYLQSPVRPPMINNEEFIEMEKHNKELKDQLDSLERNKMIEMEALKLHHDKLILHRESTIQSQEALLASVSFTLEQKDNEITSLKLQLDQLTNQMDITQSIATTDSLTPTSSNQGDDELKQGNSPLEDERDDILLKNKQSDKTISPDNEQYGQSSIDAKHQLALAEEKVKELMIKLEKEVARRIELKMSYDALEQERAQLASFERQKSIDRRHQEHLIEENNQLKKKVDLQQSKIDAVVTKFQGTLLSAAAAERPLSCSSDGCTDDQPWQEKRQHKMKQQELRWLQQKYDAEIERNKQLESQLVEMKSQKQSIEKQLEENNIATSSSSTLSPFRRVLSRSKSNTSLVSQNSINRNSILSSTVGTTKNHLEGWIKLPKSRGIKYGWRKMYAMTVDMKIYVMEDKPKGTDILTLQKMGKCDLLVDVRSLLFAGRSATALEMLQFSNNHSVFVLQTGNEEGHLSATLLSSKLNAVRRGIDIDQRLKLGIENLIKAATNVDQKAKAMRELDDLQGRLECLQIVANKYDRDVKMMTETLDMRPPTDLMEEGGHSYKVIETNGQQQICYHCHDRILPVQKQAWECRSCGFLCHKNCALLTLLSCQELQMLGNANAVYVQVEDEASKIRWLQGLNTMRLNALSQM